jgi:hypothetical protein
MAYLLDADVFVQAHRMHYSFAVCPGFWRWIDDAHSRKLVFSIKQVQKELLVLEDELSKWVKQRKSLFLDSEDSKTYDSQGLLSTWAADHYAQYALTEFFGAADFRLVAFAHAFGHTVVTHEVYQVCNRVKIPNACKAMDVPCITTFQMLQTEGARFS